METPKAVWDATASRIFCECAAKQVGLGNRPTKFLSPTGYKQLEADFNAKTGRNYDRKKFKNRWDDLKAIFSAWVFYKIKASGLGWDDATQTITADEAQWAELIKIHKPIKAFRKGPPENLDLLYKMFEKANVDGTSSMMPGVEDVAAIEIQEDTIDVEDEDTDCATPSPMIKTRLKRPTSGIPCSPSKLKKINLPKDFKRFVDHVINDGTDTTQASKNEDTEIRAIMDEVAKCGASEISDEYYMATKLFAKPSNRSFFLSMKTNEGKLNWLKRQFEDRKRN